MSVSDKRARVVVVAASDRHRKKKRGTLPSSSSFSPTTPNTSSHNVISPLSLLPSSSPPTVIMISSMVSNYALLVNCHACSPPARLTAPTTLHCGHTVCAHHVRSPSDHVSLSSSSSSPDHSPSPRQPPPPPFSLGSSYEPIIVPTCPIPSCRPQIPNFNINIPPDSPVVYYPPITTHSPDHPIAGSQQNWQSQQGPNQQHRVTIPNPRIDVSVSKILSLLDQLAEWEDAIQRGLVEPPPAHQDDVYSDNEYDADLEEEDVLENATQPLPGPSSASRPAPSSSPASPTRTRHDPTPAGPPLSSSPSAPQQQDQGEESRDEDSDTSPRKRLRRSLHRTDSPRGRERERGKERHHPPSHHQPHAPRCRNELEDRFAKELSEQLTCEICFMLLYDPVTTPCQHTFCAKCLQRTLDHGSNCPLCRRALPPFSYFQDHPPNKVINSFLLKALRQATEARSQQLEQEERDARLDTPIFICQLSFPGLPTMLHFFEPRYRLMLRRCLESRRPRFGMVMAHGAGAGVGGTHPDYGTMLEIRSVQMLPDGRSMVETVGSYRFRILEKGTLDGYMVGRIERVDDISEELEAEGEAITSDASRAPAETVESTSRPRSSSPASRSCKRRRDSVERTEEAAHPSANANPQNDPEIDRTTASASSRSRTSPPLTNPLSEDFPPLPYTIHYPSIPTLIETCQTFLQTLRSGSAPWVVQRLDTTFGPPPESPSLFSFWMALVLPIEESEKAKLLPVRSAKLRLMLVVRWIEVLQGNWVIDEFNVQVVLDRV